MFSKRLKALLRLKWRTLGIVVFLGMALSSTVDIAGDIEEGATALHLINEAVVTLLAFACFAWLYRDRLKIRARARYLQGELRQATNRATELQQQAAAHVTGLLNYIESHFNGWHLTEAERQIGLFLLKGFSLKEIADLRKTSERTVRQQAQEIYRKSELEGRAQFAGFFLEDYLAGPLPT